MTNRYFTKQAQEDARRLNVQLWDRNYLRNLIGHVDADCKEETREGIIVEQYNETRRKGSLKILNIEEKIIAIEDGEVSKALYQYLDSASRAAIDMYLSNGDENPYAMDMIKCVKKPIKLYSVSFDTCLNFIHSVYYCDMDSSFKNTSTYIKLVGWNKNERRKYADNLFKIDMLYAIGDIYINGENIRIKEMPKVSIFPDSMDGIKMMEGIEDWQKIVYTAENKTYYKGYVTENFFPIKMDNMKFDATDGGSAKRVKVEEQNNSSEEIKADKDDLRNTCIIMNAIILETYKSLGVHVKYADFRFEDGNAVFCIVPTSKTRVREILNCEKDISLRLAADIKIKMVSERGYIGIFMPIMQFKNRMEMMMKDSSLSEYYNPPCKR